jgi:hypothetical protein
MKGSAFVSHKYAGKSALRYELGVDSSWGFLFGSRVHIQPVNTDIKFFNMF